MKIKSLRELSLALSCGPVKVDYISERLKSRLSLWAKRKEVVIAGDYVFLSV